MTTAMIKKENGNQPVTFGNVVDNIFQESLHRFFDDNFWGGSGPLTGGNVPVNVRETNQEYEMDVIAPGCRREDFNINISNNMLTVSFEHTEENNKEDEKAGWVRNEYRKRSFSRNFALDDTVDVNKINATYTDGILRLHLSKNEKAKKISRKVEIK